MDVDTLTGTYEEEYNEEVHAVGNGGVYCHRCGGQGHIAAKCGTPPSRRREEKGKEDRKEEERTASAKARARAREKENGLDSEAMAENGVMDPETAATSSATKPADTVEIRRENSHR